MKDTRLTTESRSFPMIPSAWWPRALLGLIGAAIWIISIDFPGPISEGLDASWGAALVDAYLRGRQFGIDIIFTYGPWGWLEAHHFLPEAVGAKLAWEFAGKLVLAAGIVGSSLELPPWRRGILLVAVAWFYNNIEPLLFFWIVLTVLVWLFRVNTPAWLLALTVAALAFSAQIKFSYALLVASGVVLGALSLAWRGAWRRGSALVWGLGACYLAWWLAAGQDLKHLPAYWRYGWEMSSGYAQAMASDERWRIFLAGALVALMSAVYLWRTVRAYPDRRVAWPVALFLASAWFLAWKHGFTRADRHVVMFFIPSLLMAIALPGLFGPKRRWSWFDVCALGCLLGLAFATPDLFVPRPRSVIDTLVSGVQTLLAPSAVRNRFGEASYGEQVARALPELRAAVGRGTVDLLNYEQGVLLLNGLRYHPRPVFQGYAAYTPALLSKNLNFYQSARAPDFVVVKIQSIDGRYPMQDDSLVLAELPRRYDLVFGTDDYALLKRKPEGPAVPSFTRQILLEQPARVGASIELPGVRDKALWLQAWLQPSLLGELRGAIYKPALGYVVLTEDSGRETWHRLVPRILEEGFLVQPLIGSARDYAAFARRRASKWVKSIRFEPSSPNESKYWRGVTVRVSAVPELPLTSVDPLNVYVEAGIANVVPVSVRSQLGLQFVSFRDHQVVVVHAPGEIVFARKAAMARLEGEYGILEEAYTRGRTDGAEFLVAIERADGRIATIWSSWLRPVDVRGHQGPQRFRVELPADARRVILRTEPGPQGYTNWDWTYWSRLRFLP